MQLLANVVLFLLGADGRDALVGSQAKVFARDVFLRNAHIQAQAQRRPQVRGGFLAFQFGHRALQHLAIHVEPDGLDVAMLLAAKHVACAAQLQVEGGDAEARAQFAEFLHRCEAFTRDVGERGFRRNQQIGISALAGTTHAASQLVKLGEAQAVGAIDQDRVGAGNVQAIFDDGCSHQHIGFVADEFEHHAFQFFLAHLTVTHDHARLGNQVCDHGPE